jgi:hypothetical protein
VNPYKQILKAAASFLSPLGYNRNGTSFYLNNSGNLGAISFYTANSTRPGQLNFSIYLYTRSSLITKLQGRKLSANPSHVDFHYREDLGYLLPGRDEYVWKISTNTIAPSIISELGKTLITIAHPAILQHISDEQLEVYWKEGNCNGLRTYENINFLAFLSEFRNQMPANTKRIEIDYKKIVGLYACCYQAYMSIFRLNYGSWEEFQIYFEKRKLEQQCLDYFIELCKENKLAVQFDTTDPGSFYYTTISKWGKKKTCLPGNIIGAAAYLAVAFKNLLTYPEPDLQAFSMVNSRIIAFFRETLSPYIWFADRWKAEKICYYCQLENQRRYYSLNEL